MADRKAAPPAAIPSTQGVKSKKAVSAKTTPSGSTGIDLKTALYLLGSVGILLGLLGYRYYPSTSSTPTSSKSHTSSLTDFSSALTKFGPFTPNGPNPQHSVFHPHLPADRTRREAILDAAKHSWKGYEEHAWGWDELHPISKTGSNLTKVGGVGYQIVDALDTFLVMGLEKEYARAAIWVRENLDWEKDAEFSTFETTIRLLGGLLSAHHLSSIHSSPSIQADSSMYLDKAIDLADRLLSAFDTPSGIPYSNVNLAKRRGIPDMGNNGMMSTAEAASVQLEMKYLSYLTGDYVYWRAAEKVMKIIQGQAAMDGIVPIFINPQNGAFVASEIRLGSRGDSYYEYLLKQYLQTSRQETVYKDMYDNAMRGVKTHLVGKTSKSGLIFTQELVPARHPQTNDNTWQISPKQDHLVCFIGGSLILGVTEGQTTSSAPEERQYDITEREDMALGMGIIDTCLETYNTATGLGPEIAMFRLYTEPEAENEDWYIKPSNGGALIDARNILRPETVESLFLAYRATGDEKYREAGWKIFLAFEEYCKVPEGYVGIEDVRDVPPRLLDGMETFWLGETLKYLYLLFDDSSNIPLDKYVFNTEAHILPIFQPTHLTEFSTS